MSPRLPPSDPHVPARHAAILNRFDCDKLLRTNHGGRLGFLNDGWPAILPVNYVLAGNDIVIRTDAGSKFASIRRGAEVSFEIDAIDPLYRSGWSVLVYGNA